MHDLRAPAAIDPAGATTATTATAGLAGPATPRWLEHLWTWGPASLPALVGLLFLASYDPVGDGLVLALFCAVTVLAVGFRFRNPPAAWLISLAVVPMAVFATGTTGSVFSLAVLVPTLPLAALATAWPVARSLPAALGTALVLAIVGMATSEMMGFDYVAAMLGLSGLVAALAWLIGYSLRTRAQYAESLEARARDLERERDERSARAIVEERVRIARDLHDLVSHNVAVMVVQAEAADAVWDVDSERARSAVGAVAETGRSAMGELRAMLHAMRVGDGAEPGLQAQQGLAALPRVVEQLEVAGQPTTVTVHGDLGAIPAPIDGSLLRIVQEALTNVLRHAAAASAHVMVRVDDDAVAVTVEDDGIGIDASIAARRVEPGAPGGHGLLGMRERVTVLGGTLDVGPRPGGGTRVAVRIPWR
ncbi:MAG: sensor histidine kinase [Patulibacter sp.]|nr:sensor histidine kinase [Patulibacter sp.]